MPHLHPSLHLWPLPSSSSSPQPAEEIPGSVLARSHRPLLAFHSNLNRVEARMKRSIQVVLLLLLSYQFLSPVSGSQVASLCAQTHDPKLCISSTERFATAYPGAIDSEALLRMHLVGISRDCMSGKAKAMRMVRGAEGPTTRAALKTCADLYANAVDLIGVSMRALNANDAQTPQMVQIMLQEIRQSAQQCDAQFQRPGVSNPLSKVSGSIIRTTINADDLNNFMNTPMSAN